MPSKFKGFFRSKQSRSQSSPSLSTSEVSREPPTAGIAPPVPIDKGQNYGVTVLHDDGPTAVVDIVFVHGLTGNAYNTWLHKDTKVHWPSELLKQDISDARILSFGYDADIVNLWNPASKSRLSNHAENMVGDLVRMRERTNTETRKILFVAHSLGGLVAEHALCHSRNAVEGHLRQIESSTTGMIFLGVPQFGADLASWASFGTRMARALKQANIEIVKVLEPGSEMLRMVQKGFHTLLRRRKDEGAEISITCFYEELGVIGVGEIVPLRSAEISGYPIYGIHANHMDMTKFPGREDRGYDAILGELQRWKLSAYKALRNESRLAVRNYAEREENGIYIPTTPNQWMVPRSASSMYVGRKELGERLARVFSHDPVKPPIRQRVFVIVGIGGTGKSEVCLKFAEEQRDKYWGIFWLDAGSIATAQQGYIDIGRRCGVAEPSVETVKSWLATCNHLRWLLIIDNADNPDIDYSQYIPSGELGDVLLTTRLTECATYKTVGSITLEVLETDLARELLLRATDTPHNRWKEKEKAAMAVVEILGSHTLAIVQAGAFIKLKRSTLEQYPVIFQQQKEQLLKFHSKQNMSTYGNVHTTFEVSAEYLLNSESPEDKKALDYLHTLAFMHNSGISEAIFQRASEYALELREAGTRNDEEVLSLSMRHLARLPEYAQQGWSNLHGPLQWRNLCSILGSLSIITMNEKEDDGSITISMHSLVHAWAKERQDDQARCRAWQSAATILALSCEGHYEFHPNFISLQPHVRACVSHEIEVYTQSMSDMETAQQLFQFAYVLYRTEDKSSLPSLVRCIQLRLQDGDEADQGIVQEIMKLNGYISDWQGNFRVAFDVFKEIVDKHTHMLAEDHPTRLDSLHNLACAYLANEQVDKAIKLFEHVVKIKEKLSEDHPSRLLSQHELARAYLANEQVDKAIELHEHVVKMRDKLSEDHSSQLTSQHELARAYLANEQVDKAIELLEHVVKVDEKLAEDDLSRLASQHELARAYLANEQVDKALELFEHVVKIQEKLSEDDSSRLLSQHELACAYLSNEQVDKAIALLEHVVKMKEKLSEDDSSRLASLHNLAYAYLANEQVDKAIELLEHVVKRKEKLSEDDSSRLLSQHELACAYLANEQVDKAIKLLEHVVKVEEKLSEDHSSRLTSQHTLARAYLANEQVDKAIELLEHVVKMQEKLSEDHSSRLTSQHVLAQAYLANQQVDKAIELLEHIVKMRDKLSEDDSSRLASQHELACAFLANEQVDKAIQLLEHVVKMKEKLSEDHSSRLLSQYELARGYLANEQADVAISLLEHVVKVEEKMAEDDPSRLATLRLLARAYRANGQTQKAEEVLPT